MKIAQNFTKRALILSCYIVFMAGLILLSLGCEKKEEKKELLKAIDSNNTNITKAGVLSGISKGVKCSADDPNCISTLKKECPDGDSNCKTSVLTECKAGDPNCKTSVLTECKAGDPNCKVPLITECKVGDPNCKIPPLTYVANPPLTLVNNSPLTYVENPPLTYVENPHSVGVKKCGDNICQGDPIENFEICPQDCKPTTICGNGVCETVKETSITCPEDCVI